MLFALTVPTVIDRVVQQMVARVFTQEYDPLFSPHSYGFRPNRDCHKAMAEALGYLNEGRTWIIDFDIEKYFDTVNHDKLISILRENVNDAIILHLIRSFLKAGAMDDANVKHFFTSLCTLFYHSQRSLMTGRRKQKRRPRTRSCKPEEAAKAASYIEN